MARLVTSAATGGVGADVRRPAPFWPLATGNSPGPASLPRRLRCEGLVRNREGGGHSPVYTLWNLAIGI
jgi:hypothetical protein